MEQLKLIEEPVILTECPKFLDAELEKVLVLFPSRPYWFLASKEISEILPLFRDTKEGVESIARGYSVQHNLSYENVLLSFEKIKTLLDNAGVLTINGILLPKTNKTVVTGPEPIGNKTVIALTQKCNLRCLHCAQASSNENEDELTFEEIDMILDDLKVYATNHTPLVQFTGGEIFCRSDTVDIIKNALKKGFKVGFNTNGVLVTDEVVSRLAHPNLNVRVSIDGATKETHEYIRGKGTYYKTIRAIEYFVKYGVNTMLNFLIHKGNIEELEAMFELTYRLGANRLSYNRLAPVGRAIQNIESGRLIRVDDHVIFEKIHNILKKNKKYRHLVKFTQHGATIQKMLLGFKYTYRNIGHRYIFVDSDGYVYPFSYLRYPELKLGNARGEKLSSIIQESKLLKYLSHLKMSSLNDKCSRCIVRHFCGGGSEVGGMVHTYPITRDFTSPFIYCQDYKKMLLYALWAADEYRWLIDEEKISN